MPRNPQPKISGILNNCALNCALPTILNKIELLAGSENQNDFPSNDLIYANYLEIKSIFANYYHINDTAFTWAQFNTFLEKYSFADKEFIFAKVFRLFMAEQHQSNSFITVNDVALPADEQVIDHDHIQPDGRYNKIDVQDAMLKFYAPLEISVECTLITTPENSVNPIYKMQNTESTSRLAENSPIMLYFKDGHYELNRDASNHVLESMTPESQQFFAQLSSNANNEVTTAGLTAYKDYIHAELVKHRPQLDTMNTFTALISAALCLASLQLLFNCLIKDWVLFSPSGLLFTQIALYGAKQISDKIISAPLAIEATTVSDSDSNSDSDSDSDNDNDNDNDSNIDNGSNSNSNSNSNNDNDIDHSSTSNPQDPVSANFQFNCMIGFAVAGAAILCVAICAFPMVSIPILVVGAALLLTSAGIFAGQKTTEVNNNSAQPSMDH